MLFSLLFWLSIEETNAYSYYDIPVHFDSNYCKDLWLSSDRYDGCYYWDNKKNRKKRNTIGILNDIPENDLKQLLWHEHWEKIYKHTLSKQEHAVWDKFYNWDIDSLLEKYNISTDSWNYTFRDYALDSKSEMFSDLNAYHEIGRQYEPMTKEWLADMWLDNVREKNGIWDDSWFNFDWNYWKYIWK